MIDQAIAAVCTRVWIGSTSKEADLLVVMLMSELRNIGKPVYLLCSSKSNKKYGSRIDNNIGNIDTAD